MRERMGVVFFKFILSFVISVGMLLMEGGDCSLVCMY